MTRIAFRRLLEYAGRAGVFPVYPAGHRLAKIPAGSVLFPHLSGRDRSEATGALVTELRTRPTTEDEIRRWWGDGGPLGVGLNAGHPYHVVDFDDPRALGEWEELLQENGLEDLLRSCLTVQTPGGYHVWANVPDCEDGSLKLACHAAPVYDDARGKSVLCRIETRGRGGYALVPPSPGYGHAWASVLHLAPMPLEDWRALIHAARLLDRTPAAPPKAPHAPRPRPQGEESPIEWFNRTQDWEELLRAAGGHSFRFVSRGLQAIRPGKGRGKGISVTTGNIDRHGNDRASQKSPNWAGMPEGNYDKFAWYAQLHFGGDFAAAARAVRQMPEFQGARRAA